MRHLSILAALLAAGPAAAQDGWQNGGPPAELGSQAARAGFGAMALVTDDIEGFMREWSGPTPPTLPTTHVAVRERPVHFMVLFYGCGAGADGNCNVTADFIILRPDGRQDGETLTGRISSGLAVADDRVRLGEAGPAVRVGPGDPAGRWTLRAIVTDHVRQVTLRVEQRVMVETPPTAAPPTT